MHLSFTFRGLEASDALKEYASEKIERTRKYFPDPIKVHVVFSQQRGYLFGVDIQITLHNGLMVKGAEANEDFYSAIDLVMAKIERQLRRYKDRIRDHKPASGPQRAFRHSVVSHDHPSEPTAATPSPATPSAASATVPAAAPAPQHRVIKEEEKFIAQPMSVDEAIMRMNLLHDSFLCFNNNQTHEINVVYRRDDGTYGLIETNHAAADHR